MNALLLIAHGSRRAESNDDVRQLAARIEQLDNDRFDLVVPSFLELAEPDIAAGIDRCVAAGATEITVLPYFLSPGRHVVEDIPRELEQARARHPAVRIDQRDHIGAAERMAAMMLDAAGGRPGNLAQ